MVWSQTQLRGVPCGHCGVCGLVQHFQQYRPERPHGFTEGVSESLLPNQPMVWAWANSPQKSNAGRGAERLRKSWWETGVWLSWLSWLCHWQFVSPLLLSALLCVLQLSRLHRLPGLSQRFPVIP